jgi:ParB-like chromosome segregation protein Spo0J
MKFRPEAEIWPILTDAEMRTLADDIDRHGQLEPIKLFDGEILDGRNRWIALTRFCSKSHEPKFIDVHPESPMAYVLSYNEHRRHLNDSQRAMAGAKALPFFEAEAKARQGSRTDLRPTSGPIGPQVERRARDQAAASVGTSSRGVQRAKAVQKRGSKALNDAVETGSLSLGKAEEIVKQYPDKRRQDKQVAAVAKSKMVTRVKGLTGEVEWYTPRRYLDAAIDVMGAIDLDPASSERAQQHVNANSYYTRHTDGLIQRWHGRVFLNPPYAMPHVRDFVTKLVTSYRGGDINEGILLTNNATDTEWYHAALRSMAALCLTRGRIRFLEATDDELVEKASPTHGQTFFYFGPNQQKFKKVFSEFGFVLYCIPDDEVA